LKKIRKESRISLESEGHVPLRHQGKKRKSETVCYDKRRSLDHCAICGSPDIVNHGVEYCEKCGKERHFVGERRRFGIFWRQKLNCGCYHKHRGRKYRVSSRVIEVRVCVACDATKGPLCPNCKRKHWRLGDQQFCRLCGFRVNC
jgi:hypothetical protein